MSSADIAGWMWIVVCVLVVRRARWWDRKFAELHAELMDSIREMRDM